MSGWEKPKPSSSSLCAFERREIRDIEIWRSANLGPAELIGDNPFALVGGTGAVWLRAKESAGVVELTAKHPRLGLQAVEIRLTAVAAETV